MNVASHKQIEFYDHQLIAHVKKWNSYLNKPMKILVQEKKMFVGKIWGLQKEQGNVILRFKKGEVPRIKQHYFLGLPTDKVSDDILEWNFSYEKFRNSQEPRYYKGIKAEVFTLNFWKTEGSWSYIIINGVDLETFQKIDEFYLKKNIKHTVIIAEKDPPVKYLENLKEYISENPNDKINNLSFEPNEKMWSPKLIDNEKDVSNEFYNLILKNKLTIIQGPPGTGKSYLASKICHLFSNRNFSICVTSLTNKALTEIADKEGFRELLLDNKVFKTNLSSDESKLIPKLQAAEDLSPSKDEVLLSTYYKLSSLYKKLIKENKRFDLLIIEEASQAFLATIAMFSSISNHVLIIGDHKQLTPIIINENEVKKIDHNIESIINGLQTCAFNNSNISYRLTKTRRLSNSASKLTSIYYNNDLYSISKKVDNSLLQSKYFNLFNSEGGVSIVKLPSSRIGFSLDNLYSLFCMIALDLIRKENVNIALLSPYKFVERKIYSEFSTKTSNFKNIIISTIHKIQGLTTDYTIFFLPLENPSFDVNDNLFNVGTSRSKKGTLIVTYNHILELNIISCETSLFLKKCYDVSDEFLKHL
tara:strand:- start:6879 stop:8642 length:1764 start_codon:yes stop_codon:yes gene_type:complete